MTYPQDFSITGLGGVERPSGQHFLWQRQNPSAAMAFPSKASLNLLVKLFCTKFGTLLLWCEPCRSCVLFVTLPYTSAAAPATVLGNSEAWPKFYIQKLCMPEAKNLPGRPLVPQPLQQGLSNFNLHKNHLKSLLKQISISNMILGDTKAAGLKT